MTFRTGCNPTNAEKNQKYTIQYTLDIRDTLGQIYIMCPSYPTAPYISSIKLVVVLYEIVNNVAEEVKWVRQCIITYDILNI